MPPNSHAAAYPAGQGAGGLRRSPRNQTSAFVTKAPGCVTPSSTGDSARTRRLFTNRKASPRGTGPAGTSTSELPRPLAKTWKPGGRGVALNVQPPPPPFLQGTRGLTANSGKCHQLSKGGLSRFLGAPQTREGPTPRESAVVCATESLGDGHGWLCQAASPSRRDRGRTSCGCERGRPTPAASGKSGWVNGTWGSRDRAAGHRAAPAHQRQMPLGNPVGVLTQQKACAPLAGSEPCVPELTGPRAATRREGPTARRSGEVTRGRGNAWLTSPETSQGATASDRLPQPRGQWGAFCGGGRGCCPCVKEPCPAPGHRCPPKRGPTAPAFLRHHQGRRLCGQAMPQSREADHRGDGHGHQAPPRADRTFQTKCFQRGLAGIWKAAE